MERPDRASRDRTQVNPETSRPDLFKFLENLFEGSDQKPERIELRQAYGPGARKYSATTIHQKEFKENAAKPSREQIVAMTNEFLDLAQSNCNAIGKPHRYGILAKHYKKNDHYYGVFVLSLRPRQTNSEGDLDEDGEEDDGENWSRDTKRRDALLQYSLDHIKQADENERWRQDQFSTATGDIIQKYQNLVEMLMAQNLEMQREHRELFKTADEALSHKHEREMEAKMQDFKMSALGDGLQFFKQMFPIAVNQITGKQTIPTKQTPESIAFSEFLNGLSDAQAQALFGEIVEAPDGSKKLKPTGLFTPEQAKIFAGISSCERPVTDIDLLFEGEHAITQAQLERAPQIVSPQQFMPLIALVMQRKKKQVESSEG